MLVWFVVMYLAVTVGIGPVRVYTREKRERFCGRWS